MFNLNNTCINLFLYVSILRSRNGKDVSEDSQLTKRYQIIDNEFKFVINKPDEKDAGTYSCSVSDLNESAEIIVAGKLRNTICNLFKCISYLKSVKLTIVYLSF